MPKIIENIRQKLIDEARRQVIEESYSSMTIRSVAKACDVGVGTVYNYFPSKDMLVASFMLEDWMQCVEAFNKACENAVAADALRSIYQELNRFKGKYHTLFSDKSAGAGYASSFQLRHGQLRQQIAEALKPICKKQSSKDEAFLAEFLAEAMLSWTMAGCEYQQLEEVLLKLL
jgi:AcrR family transcriptional regulator